MPSVKVRIENLEFTFSDDDVVNPDDAIYAGESNPHNVRPWLLHDHGFPIAVAFADCEQDALDEIADSGKLDSFKPDDYWIEYKAELAKYYSDTGSDQFTSLGNDGAPYDLSGLDCNSLIALPNPRRATFCESLAIFLAERERIVG